MYADGQTRTTKNPRSYDGGGFLNIFRASTAVFWCGSRNRKAPQDPHKYYLRWIVFLVLDANMDAKINPARTY